ncbi:hypothetical protein [Actinomyces dentalis]|uniref:hypothetical protein n=1 Tax=Actinomyces dentalis TaxID=272548 RepID=UPI0004209AB0|nr:hypothetical protein [Actinomyces dentalis]
MTSRFPKALAVVVLVLATALSGCGPSPGSAESTSAPGATAAAGLDPRYEEGAFGAWSASLHTDAGDARALSEKDVSSDGGVRAWVDDDGGTAVFALSYGSYVSTLTAVDMRDGSTRWTVDLKDHRRASESVEAPLILGDFGFGDEYCLPMTVQNHVVCDNVGLIDMRDGAVAEIPETTDFMGIGSGEAQDVVVGNLGGNAVPVGVAAWSVAGEELWRRDDLILDLSSVGSTWAVARRSGSRTSYEVVSLTDGATLSSFELPDGGFGANLAMATTEGVLTFGFLFNNGPQAQYKVELFDAGGGSLRVLAPAAQIENRQLSISAWPEEVLEHIPTPETALAGIEGPGRIRSRDDDWYRGDSNTETVTRVDAPDVPLPGIDEFGPVGDAVLTFDTDSLNAYAAADARPLWELDLGAPDAINSHRRVKRAGRFGFLIGRQTDGGATTATLLAPGRPGSAGAGGSGDLTWEASTASGAPGISRSASDSGAAPGSPSAPSTAPAPAPSASMPPITVSPPSGGGAVSGLQAFSDDLAAANFDGIRQACWTVADSTMDRQYFSASSRAGILDAIAGPGETTPDGARWKGTAGTVVVSSEELSSPYACPSYQPGGTAEELTADDARLLLTRIVGIAEGSPVRSGDNGHYDLFCQDWRTFTTPAMTASLHMMLEGEITVTLSSSDASSRRYTVTSTSNPSSPTLVQNTTNASVCMDG